MWNCLGFETGVKDSSKLTHSFESIIFQQTRLFWMSVYRTSKSMRFLFFPQYKVSFRVCMCVCARHRQRKRDSESVRKSLCLCGRATHEKERFPMYEILRVHAKFICFGYSMHIRYIACLLLICVYMILSLLWVFDSKLLEQNVAPHMTLTKIYWRLHFKLYINKVTPCIPRREKVLSFSVRSTLLASENFYHGYKRYINTVGVDLHRAVLGYGNLGC